jgi:hypothetical protein
MTALIALMGNLQHRLQSARAVGPQDKAGGISVDGLQPFADTRQPDADRGRIREPATRVRYRNPKTVPTVFDRDGNLAAIDLGLDSVFDGVLNKGLQQHGGKGQIAQMGGDIYSAAESVPHPDLVNV